MEQTVQTALSELLGALGFEQMARDVMGETDRDRLSRYARIVVKNAPEAQRMALHSRFVMLRLI